MITLIKSKGIGAILNKSIYSLPNRSLSMIDESYDVNLLNVSHQSKIIIKKFGKIEDDKFSANNLIKEIVKFN